MFTSSLCTSSLFTSSLFTSPLKRIAAIIFFTIPWISPLAVAESLETFVESSSQQLLALIDSGRADFSKDPSALYSQVDNALGSLVDFETITRGVMGTYYKRATQEQKQAFQQTFRRSVIELYTKALVTFKSKTINVIPLKTAATSKATLSMKVTAQDGTAFTLIYSMIKKESQWRVRNIIVNGINLGLTYRSQFTSKMTEHNDNIDAVIKAWQSSVPVNNA